MEEAVVWSQGFKKGDLMADVGAQEEKKQSNTGRKPGRGQLVEETCLSPLPVGMMRIRKGTGLTLGLS
jgi:hypothetical protein